jgi:nitrogen regulatory protein PII
VLVMVTALIKPHRIDAVQRALADIDATDAVLSEVRGFGVQGGHTETYRGAEYRIDLVPKLRVDVMCDDDQVDAVIGAVLRSAATGRIGDGKIWVTPLEREVVAPTAGVDGAT